MYPAHKTFFIFLLGCLVLEICFLSVCANATTEPVHWSQQRYGISGIPPTNATLVQQEHDQHKKENLQNIHDIVERVVSEELTDSNDKKLYFKKHKKNKKKNQKMREKHSRAKHKTQTAQALVDLLVPEIRQLLEKQYNDPELMEKKITISLDGVKLRKAIELISKLSGINFVMDADVDGLVRNFAFKDASLSAVLHILLSNNVPRLVLVKEWDVWRIMKHSAAIEDFKVKAEKSIEQDTVSATTIMYHTIWNVEFKKRIEQLWNGIIGQQNSKSHYIVFDDESRTIFCRGRKHFVHDFKAALKEIDHYTPQVRIDARVVIACKDFEESIGFEWSGIYDRSACIKQCGFDFAGIGIGAKNVTDPAGFKDLLGWSLNFLPQAVRDIRTIKIPFVFGNNNLSTTRLNFMLNAAEDRKELETILKPSLLVKSQEYAEILVGEEMPQETRLQETIEGNLTNVTTINYKDIGMKIKVKPVVSPDHKSIFLDIFVQNSYIASSRVPVSNNPQSLNLASFPYTIVTSRSSNRVILCDGQTTMISGLMENTKKNVHTGVPWIQEIPVIGWLFKGKQKKLVDKQLLIFITPTLV